jgi:hypothetical protein
MGTLLFDARLLPLSPRAYFHSLHCPHFGAGYWSKVQGCLACTDTIRFDITCSRQPPLILQHARSPVRGAFSDRRFNNYWLVRLHKSHSVFSPGTIYCFPCRLYNVTCCVFSRTYSRVRAYSLDGQASSSKSRGAGQGRRHNQQPCQPIR